MPFIPHWSLRTIKHKEQVALVSSRAHQSWYLAGFCLEIIPIPPQQVLLPCAFCWGFQHLSLCLLSLPPTRTSHIDSWFFNVTKIMCPSLWNQVTWNKLSSYQISWEDQCHQAQVFLHFMLIKYSLHTEKWQVIGDKSLHIDLCLLIFRILKDWNYWILNLCGIKIFLYIKQHKQAFCILFASVLMFNNDQSAFWFLEECITGALRTYYI